MKEFRCIITDYTASSYLSATKKHFLHTQKMELLLLDVITALDPITDPAKEKSATLTFELLSDDSCVTNNEFVPVHSPLDGAVCLVLGSPKIKRIKNKN